MIKAVVAEVAAKLPDVIEVGKCLPIERSWFFGVAVKGSAAK